MSLAIDADPELLTWVKIDQFVVNLDLTSRNLVVNSHVSFHLQLLTLKQAHTRVKKAIFVYVPARHKLAVLRLANIVYFCAKAEELVRHFFKMAVVQLLWSILSSWAKFAFFNFLFEVSKVIVLILKITCFAKYTLVVLWTSELTPSATSAANSL